MTDLTRLTIAESLKKLYSKEIKALELTEAYLEAIGKGNPALNAYVAITQDKAQEMARASDERLIAGKGGALEGIPLGIKDFFATKNVHTQACSQILTGFKPCYESTITSNLWADGAVMLGKLNMDEFGMGSSNETSCYGPVVSPWRRYKKTSFQEKENTEINSQKKNPEPKTLPEWDEEPLVPGGSSGGSSAAVSGFLCAGATATDTGGSIRQPAAFTATVGIKPTYGRCSRWGIVAYASSLDQAGPIARDVRDAAILLRSMASSDPKDATCADMPVPDYEAAIGKSLKGIKIGIPAEYRVKNMPKEIDSLWEKGIAWLKDSGAIICNISLRHTQYALPAYYIVACAEASSNLARYDGIRYGLRIPENDIDRMYEKSRAAGFGDEVRRRIMIGAYVLSAGHAESHYLRAQKVRNLIKKDFEAVFKDGIDAILTPATPSSAFPLAMKEKAVDPVKMYLNDIFTTTVNMAGLPAISVPAGLDSQGLPLGLQLIGRPFDEECLFKIASIIEQVAGRFEPYKWW